MRNLFTFLAAMFVLAVSGCTPAEEEVQPLTVSETAVVLSAEEDEVYVTVTAPGEWTATSSDEEWCIVSQSGEILSIYAPKNFLAEQREATVTVESGEEQVEISVLQEAGEGYNAFSVTSEQYADLKTMGGDKLSITSAYTTIPLSVKVEDEFCEWSVEVIEGEEFITVPYILYSSTDKTFDITVEENIGAEAREGKVKIWSEFEDVSCVYILTIKQAAGSGELLAFQVASTKYTDLPKTEGGTLTVPYRAFEVPVIVAPTLDYYKWSVEVVEGKDFVTVPELTDVEGQQSFDITLAENPTTEARTAKVKIWSKYKEFEQVYEITLNQQLSQYTALQVVPKDDELKVMSFNIYVDVKESSPSGWPHRKAACYELIRYHRPALIGLQEIMYSTSWTDLKNALRVDEYDGYGRARTTSGNEGTGILYDKRVLDLYDHDSNASTPSSGHFWLSDTPDVPSFAGNWGAAYTRMANWALFKHKKTGKTICFINTHLDTAGSAVRVKEMQLIMQKFEEYGSGCDYWISTADYNASDNTAEMKVAYEKMKNTRTAAPAGKTDNDRTYNGLQVDRPSGPIDHVLCTKSMEVVEYHTIDDDFGAPFVPFVSDHYPVYAIIKL